MAASGDFSLKKKERVTGRILVETLFKGGGSRSMSYYPLRVVYRLTPYDETPARIMVSVPKRCLRHAVNRNRVKRQVRECYRLNKHLLEHRLQEIADQTLAMAFIWQADNMMSTHDVDMRMRSLLTRIGERL